MNDFRLGTSQQMCPANPNKPIGILNYRVSLLSKIIKLFGKNNVGE